MSFRQSFLSSFQRGFSSFSNALHETASRSPSRVRVNSAPPTITQAAHAARAAQSDQSMQHRLLAPQQRVETPQGKPLYMQQKRTVVSSAYKGDEFDNMPPVVTEARDAISAWIGRGLPKKGLDEVGHKYFKQLYELRTARHKAPAVKYAAAELCKTINALSKIRNYFIDPMRPDTSDYSGRLSDLCTQKFNSNVGMECRARLLRHPELQYLVHASALKSLDVEVPSGHKDDPEGQLVDEELAMIVAYVHPSWGMFECTNLLNSAGPDSVQEKFRSSELGKPFAAFNKVLENGLEKLPKQEKVLYKGLELTDRENHLIPLYEKAMQEGGYVQSNHVSSATDNQSSSYVGKSTYEYQLTMKGNAVSVSDFHDPETEADAEFVLLSGTRFYPTKISQETHPRTGSPFINIECVTDRDKKSAKQELSN